MKCEEDKIKELLERGDTAVIFPEPVSDHEDDNGSHTGGTLCLFLLGGPGGCEATFHSIPLSHLSFFVEYGVMVE